MGTSKIMLPAVALVLVTVILTGHYEGRTTLAAPPSEVKQPAEKGDDTSLDNFRKAVAEAEAQLKAAKDGEKEDKEAAWRQLLLLYYRQVMLLGKQEHYVRAFLLADEGVERERVSPFAGGERSMVAYARFRLIEHTVHGNGVALMQVLKSREIDWRTKKVILDYLSEMIQKEYTKE